MSGHGDQVERAGIIPLAVHTPDQRLPEGDTDRSIADTPVQRRLTSQRGEGI